jgi:hypothetical protein
MHQLERTMRQDAPIPSKVNCERNTVNYWCRFQSRLFPQSSFRLTSSRGTYNSVGVSKPCSEQSEARGDPYGERDHESSQHKHAERGKEEAHICNEVGMTWWAQRYLLLESSISYMPDISAQEVGFVYMIKPGDVTTHTMCAFSFSFQVSTRHK